MYFTFISPYLPTSPLPSSQLQRTSILLENRIQFAGRELQHRSRERQHRVQTVRHVIRRDLIQQTDRIIAIQTELPVRHGGPETAQGIEIVLADISSQKDRVHAVHLNEVVGDIDQSHRTSAVEPAFGRDLFRIVEDELAAADVLGTEEELLDREVRVAFDAETWEELEEETRGAVEENGFWTEVEVGVVGLGLGIALGHVECHVGKVEVTASCSSHHAEECTIEGEVVGFGEEVIGASEGSVCFEFLQQRNGSM